MANFGVLSHPKVSFNVYFWLNALTCFPEQVTLLMIWIEGLSKSVWLKKTVGKK
jgi:hypothetical protein